MTVNDLENLSNIFFQTLFLIILISYLRLQHMFSTNFSKFSTIMHKINFLKNPRWVQNPKPDLLCETIYIKKIYGGGGGFPNDSGSPLGLIGCSK